MDFQLLEQLLDEIATYDLARIVTFHLMGEPFIYPHIFQAIHSAVQRSLQLHLTTNGSTFHLFPKHIEQLVQSGVPKVTVSLQTPDPETFQLRGAPPRLAPEAYFEGITELVQANLRDTQSPTRIHVKFLDTTAHPFLVPHKPIAIVEGKLRMQEKLNHWAQRLLYGLPDSEVDWTQISRAITRYRPGRWQLVPLHPKLVLETFPLDSWGNVEADQVIPAKVGYCNGASKQAGVLHNGTVVPCCKDFEGQIPLGNVTDRSLRDILDGTLACTLRQDFNRLQVNHPVCKQCIGADTPLKSGLRQVGSVVYFKAYSPLMRLMHAGWGEV